MATKKITGILPPATLTQKLRSMSTVQLMDAAKALAQDPNQDKLCTAVLEALEARPGIKGSEAFNAFISEIF